MVGGLRVLYMAVDAVQILLFLTGLFYLSTAISSLFPFKYKKFDDKYKKIIVLIPAHNEEKVIKRLLLSLKSQDYPKEYLNIFVIDDNSCDLTANIALDYGVDVLYCKKNINSKGSVIADAITQVYKKDFEFDAIAFFDADNVVDTYFFDKINACLQQGNLVVQGYVDALNPNDTWVSYSYSMWYWITNRISQMGFSRLGLSSRINGTGFVISKEALRIAPWHVSTAAEDIEYTAILNRKGINVVYAPEAIVYDQKPTEFKVSIYQRKRWAKGTIEVLKKNIFKINDIRYLLSFLNDILMPMCWILFAVIDVFAFMSVLGQKSINFVSIWIKPINFFLLNSYIFGSVLAVHLGLSIDKKINKKLIYNIFGFAMYIFSWVPIGIHGFFCKKNEWYHTKH